MQVNRLVVRLGWAHAGLHCIISECRGGCHNAKVLSYLTRKGRYSIPRSKRISCLLLFIKLKVRLVLGSASLKAIYCSDSDCGPPPIFQASTIDINCMHRHSSFSRNFRLTQCHNSATDSQRDLQRVIEESTTRIMKTRE